MIPKRPESRRPLTVRPVHSEDGLLSLRSIHGSTVNEYLTSPEMEMYDIHLWGRVWLHTIWILSLWGEITFQISYHLRVLVCIPRSPSSAFFHEWFGKIPKLIWEVSSGLCNHKLCSWWWLMIVLDHLGLSAMLKEGSFVAWVVIIWLLVSSTLELNHTRAYVDTHWSQAYVDTHWSQSAWMNPVWMKRVC